MFLPYQGGAYTNLRPKIKDLGSKDEALGFLETRQLSKHRQEAQSTYSDVREEKQRPAANGGTAPSSRRRPKSAEQPAKAADKLALSSNNDAERDNSTSSRGSSSNSSNGTTSTTSGTTTTTGGSSKSAGQPDLIVIHVCDENRKINRDFSCQKTLLLEEMKYFRTYLTVTSAFDDIDISVHCDVHIFEWLVKYIHQPQKPPSLDARSVVSILISADFLEMDRLVKQCLAFMKSHINEIVKMPIDLNCMNDKLLSQLTALFNDEDLEGVRDTKDKLCSKMYMKKLQELLDDEAAKLQCCCHCGKLYTAELHGKVFCRKAKMFVDFHGEMVASCQPSKGWNVNNYVKQLRAEEMAWREIYWKIWGATRVLVSTDGTYFVSNEYNHRNYHAEPADCQLSQNRGTHPCCGAIGYRFWPWVEPLGCKGSKYSVAPGEDEEQQEMLQKLEAHTSLICLPYGTDESAAMKTKAQGTAVDDGASAAAESAGTAKSSKDSSSTGTSGRGNNRGSKMGGGGARRPSRREASKARPGRNGGEGLCQGVPSAVSSAYPAFLNTRSFFSNSGFTHTSSPCSPAYPTEAGVAT
jgi:hypothetical protein